MSDPTVPTTEQVLDTIREHQMTAVGRGEMACGCTPGWMSTYTYYEHLARAVQALYEPLVAELDRLRARVQRALVEHDHADTCGVLLISPSADFQPVCGCWRAALADPDDTAHPDTEEGR